MKKNELKNAILAIAATLDNEEYTLSDELTEELVFAERPQLEDEDDEYCDAGVIIEKDSDGNITAYVDDGCTDPVSLPIDEFVELYGK